MAPTARRGPARAWLVAIPLLAGCTAPLPRAGLDCAAIASRIANERSLIADLEPTGAGTNAGNSLLPGHQAFELERREYRADQRRAQDRIAALETMSRDQGCGR